MKPIEDVRRDNLAQAIDELLGGNQTAAATRLGYDKPTLLNHWLAGRKNISTPSARKIEAGLGLAPYWLDADHQTPVKPHKEAEVGEQVEQGSSAATPYNLATDSPGRGDLPHPTEEEFALVPQLDVLASCGEGRFNDHIVVNGGRAFKKADLRRYGVPEHAARLIVAAGGSMAPKIQDGRDVLINLEDRDPRENKVYAICTPYDGLVLKRLVREYNPAAGAEVWMLKSDNPDKTMFPDKMLPPDERTIIVGRAVWTDTLL